MRTHSRLRHRVALAAATAVVGAAAVSGVTAIPAQAVTPNNFSLKCNVGNTALVAIVGVDTLVTSVTLEGAMDVLSVGNGIYGSECGSKGYSISANVTMKSIPAGDTVTSIGSMDTVKIDLDSTITSITFTATPTDGGEPITGLTVTVNPSNSNPPSPGPNRSRTASAVTQPVAAQLSLGAAANSGFTCKDGSSVSGYVGQWLALPTDCTLPARSNAKLLGWSTSADFPVAIAQRQVDQGWGAYELTNEAGQLTAVFIPAGHSALVSGGNTLHPIWSA